MNLSFEHVFEPGTDPSAPPLLLLHGTGGDEHDLLPLGRALAPGAALLSPRGQVSERGALRFFARLGEGVFDPAEVTRRTNQLADFIAAAVRAYGIDPARLTAVGLSNGANIAATLLLLRPESLAGAVLLRPMVVLDQPAPPGSLAGRRVLIAGGSRDPIVPNSHPPRLAEQLRAGGASVTVHMSAVGHGLVPDDLTVGKKFLAGR
ncbi:MAG: alpha/beta hydrolase [Verrucomicrobia bacterium]|nr:alpha/beta hydrolase [Verrucomicrobiota bacterium]